MVSRCGRAAAACLVAAAFAGATACGGAGNDGGPAPGPTAVLATALAAFEQRDVDALCDTLSHRAKLVIGHAAHERAPLDCRSDIRRFFEWIDPHDPDSEPRVASVSKPAAGRAVVRVRLPGRHSPVVVIPFSLEDGQWKLGGLFDATLSRIQARGTPQADRLTPAAPQLPPSKPAAGAVTVRDPSARGTPPCPAVSIQHFPEVSGGCVLEAAGDQLALSVQTAFGSIDFADCGVSYTLRVDGRGRAWVADFTIDGGNPCFDAMPCWDRSRTKIPWRASIRHGRDGNGLRLDVDDACLDTCLGRFEGRWSVDLVERERTWRLPAAGGMIGTSGWLFDGAVATAGKPIAIDG